MGEALALDAAWLFAAFLIECRLGRSDTGGTAGTGGAVDLALAESALTGLHAWLESAPPGSHLDVVL